MILVETSAWVEYLRGTESPAHLRVADLIRSGVHLGTTGPVMMELVSGARGQAEARQLRRMLAGCTFIPAIDPFDYVEATAIYRTSRSAGHTIRNLTDCLIAAVAIRENAHILHHDRDFDAIARHAPLVLA